MKRRAGLALQHCKVYIGAPVLARTVTPSAQCTDLAKARGTTAAQAVNFSPRTIGVIVPACATTSLGARASGSGRCLRVRLEHCPDRWSMAWWY